MLRIISGENIEHLIKLNTFCFEEIVLSRFSGVDGKNSKKYKEKNCIQGEVSIKLAITSTF